MKVLSKEKIFLFLIIAIGVILYTWKLDKVPVHLNQDELEFSLNAYSISQTLHDSYGNFLPFYFKHLGTFWATPVIVYLTSIFLKFLPLAEWSVRLPSVFMGVLSIFLVFILSKKLFKNDFLPLFSAGVMLTTPVLFMNSRLLLDNVYPLPFVLLWLIFLKKTVDEENWRGAFFSGLALGIGFHSYHAAKIMVPVYAIMALVLLWKSSRDKLKLIGIFIIGLFIPLLLFIPWLKIHPDTITSQVSYVSGIDKSINSSQGYLGILNPMRFPAFLSSYGNYLSPGILFFTGDRSLIHSTRTAGAFLFPIVFLTVFGILSVLFKRKDSFSRLILFGFLTYPIAPSLINDPERISRGLIVIPFVVLLSTYGAEFLLSLKEKSFRFLLYAVIGFSFIQFISFISFYFGGYRKISYSWFNYNIGGAFESALKSTQIRPVENIYIDSSIPFSDRYLKYYEIKLNIFPAAPINYFDAKKENFLGFPKGSLIVIPTWTYSTREERVGVFDKIEIIREPDGVESFNIFWNEGNARMK